MLRFLQVVAIASLVSTRAVLPRLLKISRRKHSVATHQKKMPSNIAKNWLMPRINTS
jgi:hypothetical protein